jgi:primosomal protein N' (replication factor Y)
VVFDLPLKMRFTYAIDGKGEAAPGKRVMAPFGRRELLGFVVAAREAPGPETPPESIKAIRRVVDKAPLFGEREVALAEWIAAYYLCGPGEALSAMLPSGKRAPSFSGIAEEDLETAAERHTLSEEQRTAADAVIEAVHKIKEKSSTSKVEFSKIFYLYGITGSGKTEVFLTAAEEVIREGGAVIYLVPEISLTYQTARTIKRRFGPRAATLHSGLKGSARLAEWMRIRRGEVDIVVGPRSAVFAPLSNLRLVIIDEEQDGSYKSGNTPRYHARQTAMHRCAAEGAVLFMGSATPSVEAWRLMEEGAIRRLSLSRRIAGGAAPEIIPVSLEGAEGCLSPLLKEEIRKTAAAGRQSILFLNRRGFSYFYHCPVCGADLTCKNCSVSLTYPKARGRAVCHYCGYSVPPPAACPECGSLEAGFLGFGTEMIEEEVRRTFPDLRVRRVDADTGAAGESLGETLDLFRKGEIDLLLGTQMVAKGLNFPGVRLVGVVFADTGLRLPDFRAAERTFSLIVQVAGRAGRYFPDGKVIVQTLRPNDPAIAEACALNVEGFFRREIEQRRDLGFPPHGRLIRFTFRAREEARADAAASRMAAILETALAPGDSMLGPAECPLALIAGNHRRHILLRGESMGTLHRAARTALDAYEKGRDSRVYVETDVDPVSLL